MPLDPQTALDIAMAGVMGVLGWFARELWSAVKELRADLSRLREELPKTYVNKEDWREDFKEMRSVLDKIYTKLDAKADK
jgi:hypothetical protein